MWCGCALLLFLPRLWRSAARSPCHPCGLRHTKVSRPRLPPAAPAGGGKWPELLLGLLARVINPQLAGAQECSAHKDVTVDAYLRKSATSCAFAERLRGGGGASSMDFVVAHSIC